MELVFIHGPTASGKLTIALELASTTGYRLFHNHLGVDLALALFEFGTAPFVELREKVWMSSFEAAASSGTSTIFTFHPEATVSPTLPERIVSLVTSFGGSVRFVELLCSEPEVERRIGNESRSAFRKLRSLSEYRRLRECDAFSYPELPRPLCRIDTEVLNPQEAAAEILASLQRAAQQGAAVDVR